MYRVGIIVNIKRLIHAPETRITHPLPRNTLTFALSISAFAHNRLSINELASCTCSVRTAK